MELTVEQAAAALGVSEQYVRKLARSGKLAARRGSGGSWLIDAQSLQGPSRNLGPATVSYLDGGHVETGECSRPACRREHDRLSEENRQLKEALAGLLPLVEKYVRER